jgi:hypothetical protein
MNAASSVRRVRSGASCRDALQYGREFNEAQKVKKLADPNNYGTLTVVDLATDMQPEVRHVHKLYT